MTDNKKILDCTTCEIKMEHGHDEYGFYVIIKCKNCVNEINVDCLCEDGYFKIHEDNFDESLDCICAVSKIFHKHDGDEYITIKCRKGCYKGYNSRFCCPCGCNNGFQTEYVSKKKTLTYCCECNGRGYICNTCASDTENCEDCDSTGVERIKRY